MQRYSKLRSISESFPLAAFDVGARGGAKHDLSPLASGVDYVLFEPEKEAYDRLPSQLSGQGWRSVRCVNTALAAESGSFPLNLYRQRGCSSRFAAADGVGDLYSRGDYYVLDGVVDVQAQTLDELVSDGEVISPNFIKIDVQGMELEVFLGSATALKSTVVGIRAEVNFFPMYEGQPLFPEIDLHLRPMGFVPMQWLEFHEWRRRTRRKYPNSAKDILPISRGQMMHADVLYLLHPEGLNSNTDQEKERLVRLGVVAACYGHFDHAAAAFSKSGVREMIIDRARVDPMEALVALSRADYKDKFGWGGWKKILNKCTKFGSIPLSA